MFLSIKFYLAFFGPCFQSIDPDFVEQQFGVIHNFYTQAIPRPYPVDYPHPGDYPCRPVTCSRHRDSTTFQRVTHLVFTFEGLRMHR